MAASHHISNESHIPATNIKTQIQKLSCFFYRFVIFNGLNFCFGFVEQRHQQLYVKKRTVIAKVAQKVEERQNEHE